MNTHLRWSIERVDEWYARQPWLVGCNFIPSNAINQLEMWQAETFDPAVIDCELGWAAGIGFNTCRNAKLAGNFYTFQKEREIEKRLSTGQMHLRGGDVVVDGLQRCINGVDIHPVGPARPAVVYTMPAGIVTPVR